MDAVDINSEEHVLAALAGNGKLFEQVVQFVQVMRQLQTEIKYYTSGDHIRAPAQLPRHVSDFMLQSFSFSKDRLLRWWASLKDIVWSEPLRPLMDHEIDLFQNFGPAISFKKEKRLSHRVFYPPSLDCPHCRHRLGEEKRHEATLFTLRNGAVAAYVTSLYCRRQDCIAKNTRYYHNYSVRKDQTSEAMIRTYYGGVPDVIQCGEHVLIESDLCEFFANMMLYTWTSAANCANLYNSSLAGTTHLQPTAWPTTFILSDRKVWHAFLIHSLLLDYRDAQNGQILHLRHDCEHEERLAAFVRARNQRIAEHGDAVARNHICDLCCVVMQPADNVDIRLDAVVMDGVTIGHPCCAEHNCIVPLRSKRDQFCPQHAHLARVCCITKPPCNQPVEDGFRSCKDPLHRTLDLSQQERGKSFFQLSQRKHRVYQTTNSNVLEEADVSGDVRVHSSDEESELECETKPASGNKKLRARWTRRRTHNEQLIVRPCGVIVARQTMFGSEGIGVVKNFLRHVYRSQDQLPSVIFYDNNCNMQRHIKNQPADLKFFKDVIMPVDVFHFKSKHKVTDEYCQKHCNPAIWPELYDTKAEKWVFNSSVAEQTNSWIGSYQAIVREMTADNYNFFLDEMIRRHNNSTIIKLAQRGQRPFDGANL